MGRIVSADGDPHPSRQKKFAPAGAPASPFAGVAEKTARESAVFIRGKRAQALE